METRKKDFIQRKDGEGWEIKNKIPFRIKCCDCGLEHELVVYAPKLRQGTPLGIAAKRSKRVKRIVNVPPRKPGEAGKWLKKIGKPVDPKGWE